MRKKIDPVVDEAIETLNMKDGPTRRRLLEGPAVQRHGGRLRADRGLQFIELQQCRSVVDGEGSRR